MRYRAPSPDQVRERAVRLVLATQDDHDSQWAAIRSVAAKIGASAETVRNWVRQAERDAGVAAGPTTDELIELKRLRRENAELRRANEILKSEAVAVQAILNAPIAVNELALAAWLLWKGFTDPSPTALPDDIDLGGSRP